MNTDSFPLASVLTIVFVVLKLTDVITWSWWWVLSPVWISAGLSFFILIVGASLFFTFRILNNLKNDKYLDNED